MVAYKPEKTSGFGGNPIHVTFGLGQGWVTVKRGQHHTLYRKMSNPVSLL